MYIKIFLQDYFVMKKKSFFVVVVLSWNIASPFTLGCIKCITEAR